MLPLCDVHSLTLRHCVCWASTTHALAAAVFTHSTATWLHNAVRPNLPNLIILNPPLQFWTFSALASGGVLFALFSAPFWYAGWQLAGQAFGGALTKERFAVGRNKFRLAQVQACGVHWKFCMRVCAQLACTLLVFESPPTIHLTPPAAFHQELAVMKDGVARFLGQGYRSQEGDASDLSGARVVTTVIVNGVPKTAIEVVAGVKTYRCA